MYREQLLEHLSSLDLPNGEYCLFGGVCLAIRNIRQTDDIDAYVTQELYKQLKDADWQEIKEVGRMPYLQKNVDGVECEAFVTSDSPGWQPDIPRYLARPEIIAGYPFMPLKDLYEWKANVRRPKDVRDLKLIEEFWARNQEETPRAGEDS